MARRWTRNAVDYTNRMPAIAAAASCLKAETFTIDGEADVVGPDEGSRATPSGAALRPRGAR
jgi:ATP-dependent DNA ligase